VGEIKRKLVEDVARPVIFYPRGATCRKPELKGLTIMVNSIYNGWRYEDAWLYPRGLLPLRAGPC
jgi:peptide/nickel transport system substrate-binding protein